MIYIYIRLGAVAGKKPVTDNSKKIANEHFVR